MNLTHHIQLRYVQRIKGIKNERDAATYLFNNHYEVYYLVSKMIGESTVVYERFAPEGSGSTYNYYLHDKKVLIVQSANTGEWITLYPVQVDENQQFNQVAVDILCREIRQRNENIARLKSLKQERDSIACQLEANTKNLQYYMIDRRSEELSGYLSYLKSKTDEAVSNCTSTTLELRDEKREVRKLLDKLLFGFKSFKFEEQKTL